MTNSRYGRGLILAITTPQSLKVKDREIYYVQSEKRIGFTYTVDYEAGICDCPDSKYREDICKHFNKVVMEKAME